ncbi:biotin/lipoyl-containing protein, partial [Curtobacterium citreum]
MSESVSLPALGESVTEGTVTRWLKNVGDRVEVDEPLLEVSTDKVDTEIPSPVAGVIEEILVQEDETVEVGTALVKIGDGSSDSGSSDAGSSDESSNEAAAEAEAPEAEPSTEQESETPAPEPTEPEPAPAGQT